MAGTVPSTVASPGEWWAPVVFPDANSICEKGTARVEQSLREASTTLPQFFTPRELRRAHSQREERGNGLSYADMQQASEAAWRSRPAVFSVRVPQEARNHIGTAFGASVFDWHMRAAVSFACGMLEPKAQHRNIRVAAGRVECISPVLVGDEVRAYAEGGACAPGGEGADSHGVQRVHVSLVAHRSGGFSGSPVTYMEVGHSEFVLRPGTFSGSPKGEAHPFPSETISAALRNLRARCYAAGSTGTGDMEAHIRRCAQLAAIVDLQFYLAACRSLRADQAPHTVATRALTLHFSPELAGHPVRPGELTVRCNQVHRNDTSIDRSSITVRGDVLLHDLPVVHATTKNVALGCCSTHYGSR